MNITVEDKDRVYTIAAEDREFLEAFLLTLEQMRPEKPLRLMESEGEA